MKFKSFLAVSLVALLFLIAGCGDETSADGGEVFTAAAAKNTDSKINVQILKLLVEDRTDHKVEIVEDLPASAQIFAGIEREEFDFASLFSGEVYNNYFDAVEYSTNPDKTLKQAQSFFGDEYDIKWYDPIGYINNYSIAVKQDFAKKNNVKTISDLEKYADELTLGTDNAWIERDNDGYEGFQETYGYKFADARGMDVALMYQGIASDELDVVTAYTVDPQLKKHDLKVLKDDKEFFPPYEASIVARNSVIEEYPKIDDIVKSTVGLISTEKMTDLIYEVDIEKRSIKEVSKEFLKEKGMLD
ncbi:ABC transporter substrate-binding protein [Virgibacillus necropolis]|uniref:Glycine/betaine ABC transporter substrate-binding protein n=1 Tax=Virgibacillus necropolis TaxID=163877 RepID=A0A221MFC3_9BACI|nr:glycine betaine ABC transporter substrate-binding protein [Virgibacillus necropolis]ASN06310.1 glycine/betaine ABC transporter substrate-binding protein [Virgibacillus necropolis]